MIFFIFFSNFSFLENSNLMAGSGFKKFLRLVVCKTSFYLFFHFLECVILSILSYNTVNLITFPCYHHKGLCQNIHFILQGSTGVPWASAVKFLSVGRLYTIAVIPKVNYERRLLSRDHGWLKIGSLFHPCPGHQN